MKKLFIFLTALLTAACVAACGAAQNEDSDGSVPALSEHDSESTSAQIENNSETEQNTEMKMNVTVGGRTFTATLEENDAVREFVEMMRESPVSVEMRDYSGFEKVGGLGRSLTANDSQTTTVAGDIVLYCGDQIVMFYSSNSWSYTRIGHIDDLTGWEDALGSGNVTAVFTLAE